MHHILAATVAAGLLSACDTGRVNPTESAVTVPADLTAYVAAAGGDALLRVQGFRATGVAIDPADRANRRLVIEAARPANYRQRESPMGPGGLRLRTLIGYNGTQGWWAGNTMLGGDGQSPDPTVRQRAVTAAARQNFINTLAGVLPIWLPNAGITLSAIGPVTDGPDRGAMALALTVEGTPVGRLILDPDTHLPRRIVVPFLRGVRSEGGEYTVSFNEYRDVGSGVRLPYQITRGSASADVQWAISAYTLNPTFPAQTFTPVQMTR